MLSAATGRRWIPKRLHIQPASDPAAQADADALRTFAAGATWQLDDAPVEAAVLRGRTPSLVEDPQTHRGTFKPLMRVSRTRGYVLAAITTRRRPIGLLHGDRWGTPVDEHDLDRITSYAECLGVAAERTVLRRWLEGLPASAAAALRDAAGAMNTPGDTSAASTPASEGSADITTMLRSRVLSDGAAADRDGARLAGLSLRERDVLVGLAHGNTNADIAQRLGLSSETVKGHVASILRKLGVHSRAAAVALLIRRGRADGGRSVDADRSLPPT
jgi:DNA-binding CsgD family transcriptional regulator